MADRYRRNQYNRSGRGESSPYRDRDDRSWRQQEQYSTGERDWNYNEDDSYGSQMSEPYGRSDYGQRQPNYETGRDQNERYGSGGGQGYARRQSGYASAGEYNYGPSYFDTGSAGRGYGSFTSEDQGGRDFSWPATGRDARSAGRTGYGSYGASSYGYGASPREYEQRSDHERGFFERAGDEIASWFGDEEAARRREMDHRGRGPKGYTRSDERIREDANDRLTEDWQVDASNITVTVESGEITLDGTVPSRDQKRRAEDCVEDISGVRHVQNNLRVQESSTSTSSWDRNSTTSGSGETTGGSLS